MKRTKLLIAALLISIVTGAWSIPAPVKTVRASEVDVETQPAELVLTKADIVIEHGSTFDASELVVSGSYDRVELPIVSTTQLGTQELTFKAVKDLSEIKVTKSVKVVDTVNPEWVETIETVTLEYGESFDVSHRFVATDNVDGEVEVHLDESAVDIYTAGEYVATATASDSSGNTITHEYVITVNEEVIPEPEPEPEPVYVAPTSSAPATTTVAPSGGGYDASTYTPGWCTWHVATKRYVPAGWGDAVNWYYRAQAAGMAMGTTPAVGAMIVWPGRNHVAYVEAVHGDGTITISEMGAGWQQWGYAVRVISTDGAVFIY